MCSSGLTAYLASQNQNTVLVKENDQAISSLFSGVQREEHCKKSSDNMVTPEIREVYIALILIHE